MEFHQECEWQMHGNEHSNIWVNDGKWRVPDLGKPYEWALYIAQPIHFADWGGWSTRESSSWRTDWEDLELGWKVPATSATNAPIHPAGRVRCWCLQVQEETTCYETTCFKKNDPKWIKQHAAFKLRHEAIKQLGIETWLTELFPRRCPKVKWPCDMDLPYWSFQSQLPRPDDRMIENWSVVWNMAGLRLSIYWLFHHPNWLSLHHFSEG